MKKIRLLFSKKNCLKLWMNIHLRQKKCGELEEGSQKAANNEGIDFNKEMLIKKLKLFYSKTLRAKHMKKEADKVLKKNISGAFRGRRCTLLKQSRFQFHFGKYFSKTIIYKLHCNEIVKQHIIVYFQHSPKYRLNLQKIS